MKNIVPPILILAFFSGCALTMDEKTVNYSFSAPMGSYQIVEGGKKIEVGDFSDDRNPPDPRLMFYKTNMNGGRASGGYLAERPIVEILHEAISEALVSAGYEVNSSDAELLMTGKLKELDYEFIEGFFKSELNLNMTVQVLLKNISSGEVVYSENVIANHHLKDDLSIENAFREIMNDMVLEIINSEFFKSKTK